MCHHYIGVRQRPEHFVGEFSVRTNQYQLALPDDGFYPLAQVPVIRLDDAGERELAAAEWGFLPAWWRPSERTPKRSAFQRKCINARSEEVDEKPTYREAFRRRRCLMPAEAFFERGRYFHLADRQPFAFAALWERWREADGAAVDTCTLLTTQANAAVAATGHPRMPLVLWDEAAYARWLDPEIAERLPLEELLQASPAARWQSYAAPPRPARRAAEPAKLREGGGQATLFD